MATKWKIETVASTLTNKLILITCSLADRSDVPLMLAWEGEGDGGLWWGLWCGCWSCCCCCCCCWYLLFRWSMKASLLRSMSALCRLVRASRLCAALTVCRCSDVCTRPTLEKRRALFPSVRYSRGYSRSSLEIMWPPTRSGSKRRGKGGQRKGRKGGKKGGKYAGERWIITHTSMQKDFKVETYIHTAGTHRWKQMKQRRRVEI